MVTRYAEKLILGLSQIVGTWLSFFVALCLCVVVANLIALEPSSRVSVSVLAGVGVLAGLFLSHGSKSAEKSDFLSASDERANVYYQVAMQLETQAAIVGISVNDAIEEHDSGNDQIAWRLVRLSMTEWYWLVELDQIILSNIAARKKTSRIRFPKPPPMSNRYKYPPMVDYARMHGLLDGLVFSGELAFQLRLRFLRRVLETLNAEFGRAFREAEQEARVAPDFWKRLDALFHDLDVVTKEVLLAFRAFLVCVPRQGVGDLLAHLPALIGHPVSPNPRLSEERVKSTVVRKLLLTPR